MRGTIDMGAVELFVRVAELRSFRAAGDALDVPRSTVSRRVAELESALGTRLFHRTTRHVELTSAGKGYLRACGPALETITEAGRALAARPDDTAGRLRVTAPVTFAETSLGEVVGECLARHPQMRLELVLTDRQVNLVEEKFDLAFRSGTLKARGRAVEVPVRGRLVVNSLPLAMDAAARGLGIARVPEGTLVEGLAANRLVEVLDSYAPPARPFYAVYASGGRVSPAARAFLEIATRHLEGLRGHAGGNSRVDP